MKGTHRRPELGTFTGQPGWHCQGHPPQSQGTQAEPPCPLPGVLWPSLSLQPQSGLPQGIWPCSQFSWWWNRTKPSPARELMLLACTHPSPGGPRSCLPFWDLPTLGWRSPAAWGNVPTFSLYVMEADIEEGLLRPRKDRTSFLPSSHLMEVSCTFSSHHHISGVGRYFGSGCSSLGSTKAFTKPASPWPQGDGEGVCWSWGSCCPKGLGLQGEHVRGCWQAQWEKRGVRPTQI